MNWKRIWVNYFMMFRWNKLSKINFYLAYFIAFKFKKWYYRIAISIIDNKWGVMSIIYNRQSVRKFNAKGIERGELIKLIEAGITASSSKNKQPWQFIV